MSAVMATLPLYQTLQANRVKVLRALKRVGMHAFFSYFLRVHTSQHNLAHRTHRAMHRIHRVHRAN